MLDMAELAYRAGGAARRTAMVLDVRSRAFSTDLTGAVAALRARGFSPRVLFVDADDETLIRRFESVRRSHPMQGNGRLADGITAERALVADAREHGRCVDRHEPPEREPAASRVEELFGGEDARKLRVTVLSFGFKYGLPPDADFVLDARFLPNPFWVPDLRELTGRDEPVSHYVLGQRGATTFVETYARLINATAPGFEREGKRYLTVAVGCTGGKHRSVAIAEDLARRLREMRRLRIRPAPRPGAGMVTRTPLRGRRVRRRARTARVAERAAGRRGQGAARHHRGRHGRRRRRVQRPPARVRRRTAARRSPAGARRPGRPSPRASGDGRVVPTPVRFADRRRVRAPVR